MRGPKRKPMDDRFWAKVLKSEDCWEWIGTISKDGYGWFRLPGRNGKNVRSHRAGFEIQCHKIPDGAHVLHRCDNRRCVRGDHLFLGSNQDNVNDREAKRRGNPNKGSKHPRAKLTPDQVLAIRRDSRSQRVIAAEYGITNSHVSQVRRGLAYDLGV